MILKSHIVLTKQDPTVYIPLHMNWFEERHWMTVSEFVLWWIRVGLSDVVISS